MCILDQPPIEAPKKRAYFWLKVAEGGEAFGADERNEARERNIEILKENDPLDIFHKLLIINI